jgi:hypothetical protein
MNIRILLLSVLMGAGTCAAANEIDEALAHAVEVARVMTASPDEISVLIEDRFGNDVTLNGPRLLPFGDLETPHFTDDASYLIFKNTPGTQFLPFVRCERLDPNTEYWEFFLGHNRIPEGAQSVMRCNFFVAAVTPGEPLDTIASALRHAAPGVEPKVYEDRSGASVATFPLGNGIELVSLHAVHVEAEFGRIWTIGFVAAYVPTGS